TDAEGVPVSLEDQDRRRWDAELIDEGQLLLSEALAAGAPGPYAVQAAIAALHVVAPSVADSDWPQIAVLHDVLLAMTPSPMIELNRAVVVGLRDGPAAGLELIDRLTDAPEPRHNHVLHAARADLLTRHGRPAEAALAYRDALSCSASEPDRRYLQRQPRAVTALVARQDEGSG
ncbi:MAG: DUF6596 domain-containing protein, partial [Janthinobacterium lividum]